MRPYQGGGTERPLEAEMSPLDAVTPPIPTVELGAILGSQPQARPTTLCC